MRTIRLGLAQINATVGDLAGNAAKMHEHIRAARADGVELLAFPELAVTGYPPEDLLLKPGFIADNLRARDAVVRMSAGLTVVFGFVDQQDDIFNAAAVCHDGKLAGVYHKHYLPNYGVFDENRYFQEGSSQPVFLLDGVTFGVNVCEDIWYPGGPSYLQSLLGNAELIVNISASPYHHGKIAARERMLSTRAADNSAILAYCNLVGGQDELLFDGSSVVLGASGELLARSPSFEEHLLVVDVQASEVFRQRLHDPLRRKDKRHMRERAFSEPIRLAPVGPQPRGPSAGAQRPPRRTIAPRLEPLAELHQALVLGLRDYVQKSGAFRGVVIGLSGGIDSAATAVLAADALGAENVVTVAMPSRYSSSHSLEDAELLAKNLGLRHMIVPIEPAFEALLGMLAEPFEGCEEDVTEENLQARVRGVVLMALSNKFGWMVVTTGNKSEIATGYCTLYGDMVGGYNVLKDVPKTMLYELCRYRNALEDGPLIPERTITKPPSAELRPDQLDQDSLPPYDVLDRILKAYVEEDHAIEAIVGLGFERKVVERVVGMVDRSEYKRRQAAPGVRITTRAFGKDRRMPITYRRSAVPREAPGA
jgi:NAD+ synthase (glutamine-hydrolysing)